MADQEKKTFDDTEFEGKERFFETHENAEVLEVPQCVGCPHNLGKLDCKIYGTKPKDFISNIEECPR